MISILQAAVLGLVQGLTEFLPVSSSAHLTLFPWLLGWPDPGLAFDVSLHAGTLAAVLWHYRADTAHFLRDGMGFLKGGREARHWLPVKIAAATVPAVIVGKLLNDWADGALRGPLLIAGTLTVGALLMAAADRRAGRSEDIGWREALLIGCAQAVALVPGISRSGITITAALFLGLSRSAAVRFSFWLSIPVTLGAVVLKSGYLARNIGSPVVWTGILTAGVSGALAIRLLVALVRNRSLSLFVYYRIALALLILTLTFVVTPR